MTRIMTVARTLAELAALTGKSFILLEVEHMGSSSSRLSYEFGQLGQEALDAILETNVGVIEMTSSMEATAAFLELEADFPLNTPTSLIATLIRPGAETLRFTQGSGFGRTTEGFRSMANAYTVAG